jgi:hypothetical protein
MIRFALAFMLALCASVSAFAQANPPVGTPPGNGPQLIDGTWVNGLAGGRNETYQSGISAAGSTQATATQLPSGISLIEIDTVPGSSGAALPFCYPGSEFSIFNSTSTTIVFYPNVLNNPLTAAQDTINGSSSLSVSGVSGGTVSWFSCAKAGKWAAK